MREVFLCPKWLEIGICGVFGCVTQITQNSSKFIKKVVQK